MNPPLLIVSIRKDQQLADLDQDWQNKINHDITYQTDGVAGDCLNTSRAICAMRAFVVPPAVDDAILNYLVGEIYD